MLVIGGPVPASAMCTKQCPHVWHPQDCTLRESAIAESASTVVHLTGHAPRTLTQPLKIAFFKISRQMAPQPQLETFAP
jgi:hypothetical protein